MAMTVRAAPIAVLNWSLENDYRGTVFDYFDPRH
jgi:hypothetical protein